MQTPARVDSGVLQRPSRSRSGHRLSFPAENLNRAAYAVSQAYRRIGTHDALQGLSDHLHSGSKRATRKEHYRCRGKCSTPHILRIHMHSLDPIQVLLSNVFERGVPALRAYIANDGIHLDDRHSISPKAPLHRPPSGPAGRHAPPPRPPGGGSRHPGAHRGASPTARTRRARAAARS